MESEEAAQEMFKKLGARAPPLQPPPRSRILHTPRTSRASQTRSLRRDCAPRSLHALPGATADKDDNGYLDVDELREAFKELVKIEMTEDEVHSSDTIEAGWIVVRGRWYEKVQDSPRGYRLQKESRLILVNTMIRLPGIHFNGGAPGKAPRESKSGLQILHEDTYNLLNEST